MMDFLLFMDFTSVDAWMALLTLTFLEIVLGIDNIIFISIAANKLPEKEQPRARFIGLGLALVKHGVLLHKGTINLASTPGEGTEITVTFGKL